MVAIIWRPEDDTSFPYGGLQNGVIDSGGDRGDSRRANGVRLVGPQVRQELLDGTELRIRTLNWKWESTWLLDN